MNKRLSLVPRRRGRRRRPRLANDACSVFFLLVFAIIFLGILWAIDGARFGLSEVKYFCR